MKKGNIVELVIYREQHEANDRDYPASVSEELEMAIQHLIFRLRELGPIQ